MMRKQVSAFAAKLSARGRGTSSTGQGEAELQPVALQRRTANNISDLYDIGKELGNGGFAVVKQGKCKTDGTHWALKLIKSSVFRKHQEQTEREVDVLSHLTHKGVVHLREVVITPKYYVIVLELCSGGELFDRIVAREKYSENDAKTVAHHLLETMAFLHKRNVVHRDLKPENLLFDTTSEDAVLKLTDFGFASFIPADGLQDSCGTPEYVAPEIIEEKRYGAQVDMWSCGVIIYILLCGFPPFYGEEDDELFEKIRTGSFQFLRPYWDPVSDDAKDLIRKLLNINPAKRLTADQALRHQWFARASPDNDISSALDELARFNSTKKFRKAILAVIAMNKLKGLDHVLSPRD